MLNLKILTLLLITLFLPLVSVAEVIVSSIIATDASYNDYLVNLGSLQIIQLPSTGSEEDSYSIKIKASNAMFPIKNNL